MADTVLGKVSCVPRGDYDAGTAYTALDIVGYSGGSYMALRDVQGVTPGNDGTNWMQLAGPGTPGAQGERGEPGAAAGFGTATVTVDDSTGTPAASVELSGPDTAKVFAFAFSGLKGETGATGEQGPQGNPGTSVKSIRRTSGTGAAGATDTYTMYDSEDAPIGTFTVYNGSNGEGSGDFMANGTVPMTGSLSMGGNRVTGLGAPQEASDAVRQQDLEVLSDELDAVIAGTTPIAIPVATEAKAGAVKPGSGLEVTADGTLSVTATAQDLGAMPEVLGGTAGQVLTKTADGQAWQDAPDGLPEGGTTGQILTRTESGATWADAPETGVVNFNGRTGAVTPQAGDYTADMVGARSATWMPSAADVGAVPVTRTVNGQALSSNVVLDAGDVGARADDWMPTAAQVGAIPAVSGAQGQLLGFTSADVVGAVDAPSGGSGKRACRFVVGTSTAGWTADDCDYLCDGTADQVEINAAIQALPTGGGEIAILNGTYNIAGPIAVNKSNVTISGNGTATKLVVTSPSVITADDNNVRGIVTVSGQLCSIERMVIDGNSTTGGVMDYFGIYITGDACRVSYVHGRRFTGSMQQGALICLGGTRYTTINNNVFDGNGRFIASASSIPGQNNESCIICNNTVHSPNSWGIDIYGPVNSVILGNVLDVDDMGIGINYGSHNAIIGNTICATGGSNGALRINQSNENIVSGNLIYRRAGGSYPANDYSLKIFNESSNNFVNSNYLTMEAVLDSGLENTITNNI